MSAAPVLVDPPSGPPALLELILDADYSDPDVVLVDGVYWMITSTLHLSPGMAVLRSTDMLRWEHVGHVVDDLRRLGPGYERAQLSGRYGRGVYAGSIRHHEGLFHVHFTTLDDGIFTCTAQDPAGPWSAPHRLSAMTMWDDPCPLWTQDGRAWLALSNPGPEGWFSYLVPMSADGRTLFVDQRFVVDDEHTSEGNKLYQRDGWFYLLHNEVHSHGDRLAVVLRTRDLEGPWEKRVLLRGEGPDRSREPNQGALLADTEGRWWFLTHHGRTGFPEGRPLSRVEVGWEDGWPVVLGPGGPTARAVRAGEVVGSVEPRDDTFPAGRPGPQWEWFGPPPGTLPLEALGAARGTLRLPVALDTGHAAAALADPVPLVITQRSVARAATASVWVEASNLVDGAAGGLGHHSTTAAVAIAVQNRRGHLHLVLHLRGHRGHEDGWLDLGRLPPGPVQLCTDVDERSFATFGHRPDPAAPFTPVGDSYPVVFGHYRGSRVGLFAWPAPSPAGAAPSVDFSDFRHTPSTGGTTGGTTGDR